MSILPNNPETALEFLNGVRHRLGLEPLAKLPERTKAAPGLGNPIARALEGRVKVFTLASGGAFAITDDPEVAIALQLEGAGAPKEFKFVSEQEFDSFDINLPTNTIPDLFDAARPNNVLYFPGQPALGDGVSHA